MAGPANLLRADDVVATRGHLRRPARSGVSGRLQSGVFRQRIRQGSECRPGGRACPGAAHALGSRRRASRLRERPQIHARHRSLAVPQNSLVGTRGGSMAEPRVQAGAGGGWRTRPPVRRAGEGVCAHHQVGGTGAVCGRVLLL